MAGFTLTAQLDVLPPNNIGSVINQINRQLKGVSTNVNIKLPANASRQLAQLNQQLSLIGGQARKTSLDFEKLGVNAGTAIKRFAGFTIVASTFYTLSRAIQSSIDDAIDFQHELVKISQVTGTALHDLDDLASEVTNLSIKFGVSSNKLLGVAQTLAQAGLSADKTKIALEALAKTDVSPTFDNMKDTGEGVIAIMAQFGAEAEDLEGILGSLNAVAGKFAVESSDIITTVRRTGGAFEAAGGQLNELIALFTSVRATTRESAESIATGFRTIFTRIQRTRTIGFLEDLGIQLRDLEGNFIGPYKAIEQLSNALKDIETTDPRFSQVIEELGGFRQVSKVIPLIKQFTTAQQALLVAQQGQDSLARDAEKSNASLAIRITKVKEEFQDLIRTLAGNSSFAKFTQAALDLSSALIKVAKSLEPILPLIATVATFRLGVGIRQSATGFKGALGFNRGGLVPGSGSGDTVPAVLEPGEFVIRKNAVNAIGAGNLQQMNAQRANSGGLIRKRFAGGTGVTGQKGGVSAKDIQALMISNPEFVQSLREYDAKAFDTAFNQVGSANQAKKLLGSEPIKNAVALRLTNKEQSALTRENKELRQAAKTENEILAANLIPESDRTFGVISLTPPGISDGPSDKTFVNLTHEGKNIQMPYQLYSASIEKTTGEFVRDKAFTPNVISGIEAGAKKLQEYFSAKEINPIHIQNEEGILGGMFESALLAVGAPYSGKQDDGRTFDFAQGLGDLADKFGTDAAVLKNRPVDAKLSYGKSSLASIRGKIKTYYNNKINTAGKKFASGGQSTDTVPALLTPGEFVLNKDAVSSIGLGELHRMNKADKVKGYAKGGLVQRFNTGGFATSAAGILTLAPLLASLSDVSDSNRDLLRGLTSLGAQFGTFLFLNGQIKQLIPGIQGKSISDRLDTAKVTKSGLEGELEGFSQQFNKATTSLKDAELKLNRTRAARSALLASQGAQLAIARNPATSTADAAVAQAEANRLGIVAGNLRAQIVSASSDVSAQQRLKSFAEDQKAITDEKIKAEQKSIDSLSALNIGVQGLEIATLATSAALLTIGQRFTDSGKSTLRSGNIQKGREDIIFGGQLSGAGQGAAIGSSAIGIGAAAGVPGGPVGVAIGLAIGTAITAISAGAGAIYGDYAAKKIADELEKETVFASAIKPFERSLESILSGKLQARTGASTISTGTNVLLNNLRGASAEGKETARGRIDAAVLQLDQFLEKLARDSASLDQFNASVGDTLKNFALFQQIPLADVKKRFEDLIKVNLKSNEITTRLAIQQERQLVRLREFNALSSAVKDATLSFEIFSAGIESLEAIANGGSGASKFIDTSSVFDRVGNISNLSQFEGIVSQITKSLGPIANQSSQELLQINASLQGLPNLLERVTIESPNDADALLQRFDAQLTQVPDFVRSAILDNLQAQLGPEQKTEKFFDEARTNPNSVAGKLSEGIFKDIIAFFQEQAKLLNEHNNKIAGIFEKQRAIELKKIEADRKILDLRDAQEEFNRGINEQPFKFADAQRSDAARRRSFDVGDPGIQKAVNDIKQLSESIAVLDSELQTFSGESDERDKLLKQLADERNTVEKLNQYLEFMGDATQRNTGLLRAQSEQLEERKARRGIAEEFLFGGIQAKREIVVGAAGARQLAQNQDINSIPASALEPSINFLRRLGNTKLTNITGDKTGEEVLKEVIKKSGGLLTAQELGLEATPGEKIIADAINKNFEEAKAAALGQKTVLESIRDSLGKQAANFEIEKQNNLNDAQRKDLSIKGDSLATERIGIRDRLNRVRAAESVLNPIGVSAADFEAQLPALKNLKELRERSGQLVTSNTNQAINPAIDQIKELNKGLTALDVDLSINSLGGLLDASDNKIISIIEGKIDAITADNSANAISLLTGKNAANIVSDKQISKEEQFSILNDVEQKFGKIFRGQLQDAIFDIPNQTEQGIGLREFATSIPGILETIFAKNSNELATNKNTEDKIREELGVNDNQFTALLASIRVVEPLVQGIKNFNTDKIIDELDRNTTALNTLRDKIAEIPANQPLPGLAKGGPIRGVGNRDSVPIMAMPGEFMMRKEAVQAIGEDELFRMNAMARGGSARLTPEQKRAAYLASKNAKREAFYASTRGRSIVLSKFKNQERFKRDKEKFIEINKQRRAVENFEANKDEIKNTGANLIGRGVQGLLGFGTNKKPAQPKMTFQQAMGAGDFGLQAALDAQNQQADFQPLINLIIADTKTPFQKAIEGGDFGIGKALLQQQVEDRIAKKNELENLRKSAGFEPIAGFVPGQDERIKKGVEELRLKNLRAAAGFANGGYVPGQGNTDSVPAMLMPGEFVMSKAAVQTIGVDKLAKANKQGRKGYAQGGVVSGNNGVLTMNPEINAAFAKFDVSVNKLATALEAMPHTINMNVRHTVEVVFNGAEVLASLQPSLQDLVVKTTQTQINQMIRDKFPDVGTVQ